MNTYMVVCTFAASVPWEQVTAMVAQEQQAAAALRAEGVLAAVRVSVARDKVFLEVLADDADGARAVVNRLPMAVFWGLEVYEIAVPV